MSFTEKILTFLQSLEIKRQYRNGDYKWKKVHGPYNLTLGNTTRQNVKKKRIPSDSKFIVFKLVRSARVSVACINPNGFRFVGILLFVLLKLFLAFFFNLKNRPKNPENCHVVNKVGQKSQTILYSTTRFKLKWLIQVYV